MAVSRLIRWLDRLPASSRRAVLEGRDLPPLPSNSPLPGERVETRPAFRAGRRTLPRLPQTRRRGRASCTTPSCFGHPLQVLVLSCRALAVSSFVCHRYPLPPVTDIPAPHAVGSLQHLSPTQPGHPAVPPARITGQQPVMPLLCLTTRDSIGASGTAARLSW